jgi:23S rRNA (uracil1939-C5)-methyltransferase
MLKTFYFKQKCLAQNAEIAANFKLMGRKSSAPQIYEALTIIDIASEGMGIAKKEGMVVFVEGAVTGDVVDVQITRKKSGFRQGRVLNFLTKSDVRIEPACSHFGVCGGCKWQNLPYDFQVSHKFKQVSDALKAKGFEVDRKRITIPNDVKTLGEYEATIILHKQVSHKVKFVVIAE